MRKIILISLIILFNGCDGLIEMEVKLSQLLSKEQGNIHGELYIEVTSCNDFEDSRKESDFLKEAKITIPSIFKDTKYVECFEKEFQSYTHFTIPIILSKKSTLVSNDYIHLISHDKNILSVGVPAVIKQNMDRVKANSFGMTDIDLDVKIKFVNDTNKNISFKVISAYLNDKPYIYNELQLFKNNSLSIKLSDVSVDNALENGISNVLFR